jgi:hypothetical protein
MSAYTNLTGVPLSLAVFLATDNYDYDPTAISATSLIKPLKQRILAARVPAGAYKTDVLQLVKSRMGSAIHDAVEKAWVGGHYIEAMKKLGYPDDVIARVVVNPDPDNIPPNAIPVYMEQRVKREIAGKTISGKYDFIAEGRLEDFKSTSTYTWVKGMKDDDYQLQGSIYRWLNPKIITEPYMVIQYLFTDWKAGLAKSSPNYPARPVEPKKIPLLSLEDTEQYVVERIRLFDNYWNAPESELPPCGDRDLWRDEPVFKYYKNPTKLTRSTKNFDTLKEANQRLAEDGGVGIVIEKPGEVRACKFCPAFPVCQQKNEYLLDGTLVLDN